MDANKHYLKDEIFDKLMKNGFPKLGYQYAAKLLNLCSDDVRLP